MSSSKAAKDSATKQFRSITNATLVDATRILKAHNWRLDAAVDAFYSDPAAMAAAAKASSSNTKGEKESKDKLGKLFDKYKDADGPNITIDGAMEMCEDLGVSPEEPVVLALSFYLKSPSMGHYTRDGYIEGWRTISSSADTIAKQKEALVNLRKEFESDAEVKGPLANDGKGGLFTRVYEWVYAYARSEGQKSLALDTAIPFWKLLMPLSPTYAREGSDGNFTQRQLDLWEKFMTTQTSNRAVSRDTWMLFLDFSREIDENFEEHDLDAAWPSVIDDFVEWAKEQPREDAMDES